jgi:peptidoglycan/xylan/chitin deacetylase (PgdA/CDA1 family)
MSGYFVISLDFELAWGLFDHPDIYQRQKVFLNTIEVVPRILESTVEYQVNITWAVVGMLMLEDWDVWDAFRRSIKDKLPRYVNRKLDPFDFGDSARKKMDKRCFFAPELVKAISQIDGQELGTHTFSHYYCLEQGQTKEHFETDLTLAINAAKSFNCCPTSLVFPRNQFQKEYLRASRDKGITAVRTNPDVFYWRHPKRKSLSDKVLRTADAYLPFRFKGYSWNQILEKEGVLLQPASRFLRPHSQSKIANILRLKRVKSEMSHAAKNGLIYHLWWHPHNFGRNPDYSLETFDEILKHYRFLRKEFGFESKNMGQISQEFQSRICKDL